METVNSERYQSIFFGPCHTSLLTRLTAKGIDLIVLLVLFLVLDRFSYLLAWVVALTYAAVQDAVSSGRSVGKRIMGLRTRNSSSQLACSVEESALRNFPLWVSIIFVPIPWLLGLMLLVAVPFLALEIYLLSVLDSGVRLGDVIANTVVFEDEEDTLPSHV